MDRSQKAFATALVVTLGLSMLPDSWLSRGQDLAGIVSFVLTPMREGVNAVTTLLKPPPRLRPPDFEERSVDALNREVEEWRDRYYRLQLRVNDLERELAQLQQIPMERSDVAFKPVSARISGRNADDPLEGVELNRGSRAGVAPATTIAVVDAVHLIGRVTKVTVVGATLQPIASPEVGLLRARVISIDDIASAENAPVVQLVPTGEGTFTAEATKGQVKDGDRVILDDGTWPEVAQGRMIGSVENVKAKAQHPLRDVFVVRPVYQLHELATLTLIVELPGGEPGEVTGESRDF